MRTSDLRTRGAAAVDSPIVRALAIAVVLGLALVAMLVTVLWHRPPGPAAVLADPVTVKRALSSTSVLFGDPVEAEVNVVTRDASVAPASVRVNTSFAPFSVVSKKVERADVGGISLLRTRITLQCLRRACLPPPGGGRVVQFEPITVGYSRDGRASSLVVPWGPLQVSSRIPPGVATGIGIIDTAPPLDPQFRRSPELVQWVLRLAVLILALAGAVLVVAALWPPSFRARRRWARLSPLERSLLLVEAAAGSEDEVERRSTLDQLALRLGEARAPDLERQTQALAWGQAPPEPEALALLAARVRATLNGKVRA